MIQENKGVQQVIWSPGMSLEVMEQHIIVAAYAFYRGIKTTTAASLGISVRTLDAKLEIYGSQAVERENVNGLQADARARELHAHRFGRPPSNPVSEPAGAVDTSEGNGNETAAWLRTQPPPDATAEQPVSMPERREIQGVLSRQATPNRHGQRR